jgi:hypothetical protein
VSKSGGLTGAVTKAQYVRARELLKLDIIASVASVYLSMGVEPASALHDAARAAVGQGAAARGGQLRIFDLTDLVNGLATVIGEPLGFGSVVGLGDLGMSRSKSGAGAYLYEGGTGAAAALAVCLAHESLHGRQARDYTGLFTREGGTLMTSGDRETAWLDRCLKMEKLAVAALAALLCELEDRPLDLEALRAQLGEAMAWMSASERGAKGGA